MLADPNYTYLQAARGERLAFNEESFYQSLDETRERVDREYVILSAHTARLEKGLAEKTPEDLEFKHAITHWYFCTRSICKWHY
jgi:hypothetical protein